jgi:hypothetical protein
MNTLLWVLLFVAIALGGVAVLAYLGLRVWRKTGALLGEVDVLAGRVGELADLLASVDVPYATAWSSADMAPDEAWPGTVETYDDRGANAPGKKER